VLKLRICFLFYLNYTLIANANFLLHDEYTRQTKKKLPFHNEYARHNIEKVNEPYEQIVANCS